MVGILSDFKPIGKRFVYKRFRGSEVQGFKGSGFRVQGFRGSGFRVQRFSTAAGRERSVGSNKKL